jgi:hypothetical protein
MRFYCQPHRFYGGIDLHARSMYLCILDHDGNIVFDRNLPCDPKAFLHAIAPFRDGIVVGVECMFGWYWVADLCCGSAFLLWSRNAKSLSRGCPRVELTTNLDRPAERDPQVLTSRRGERVIF